jgi:glycosyltransferase involved in cell wall biosynthesis
MFCGEFPPTCGGVGYYVSNLSSALAKKGHEITILTRQSSPGVNIEESENLKVIRIFCPKFYPFHVRFHYYFVEKYYKQHLSHLFDIAHFHSPLVKFFETNIPSISTEHGTVIGGLKNTPNHDIYSILQRICSPELIALDKSVLKNVDVITCVSESCSNEIREEYGINRDIYNVGNGVDPQYFPPPSLKSSENPYILYTGRLDGRKGLIDFIDAAPIVLTKFPEMKFILTGKGSYKNFLLARINKLKLGKNFHFYNYVPTNELVKLYQNATIYVLPSYYEGLPTSLLEALSCGLPCVATDVDGNNELIINGENGILIPPHNPEKMAEAICLLLNNKELRDKYSINGRRTITELYDWDKIAEKYIQLYQKIMNHQ